MTSALSASSVSETAKRTPAAYGEKAEKPSVFRKDSYIVACAQQMPVLLKSACSVI